MSRKKRQRPRRPVSLHGKVTLPQRDYEEMQRLSTAAVRAYNTLNVEHPSLDDTTEAMWILFRALEGGMPRELQ